MGITGKDTITALPSASDSGGRERGGEAAHTPAPWIIKKFAPYRDGRFVYSVSSPVDGSAVAEVFLRTRTKGGFEVDMAEANAKLIAAAPDMYAALKGGVADMPPVIQPLGWLQTLIAECRRPEVFALIAQDDPDAADEMLRECETIVTRGKAAITKATS